MYECVYVWGGVVLLSLQKKVVKNNHNNKLESALGMYKGRSFDEQKDIMERCSILFNPTDFCLVMFSGDSQLTMADKE